ncbi:MAG TPA: Rieske 2Fe-2S domain-containing protein [Kofleriaceae bacterium]|jgi:nitrite reductase (NADH) small subunit|nr:Rieske 2Fe-2S domain-containing protein [Kofleriaceae bacterium]
MTEAWRTVARIGDVKPNDVIAVTVDGIEMVLGRDGERYFATQRRCLHRGGDLAEGIVSRGHLICPQHAWRFSTATGCNAEASEFCLVTYPVRVVGDRIEVDPRPRAAPGRAPQPEE